MNDSCSVNNSNAIFLTGGTGLVGGLLLRRLAEQNPNRVIFALVRRPLGFPPLPNTCLITGDISQLRFGLAKDLYAQLCASVGTIVHCAASTKFTLPLEESRKANVQGTENVLELAHRSKGLERLLHISTVYIAGRKSGPLAETEFIYPEGWFSPYEQSKFEAEKVFWKSGLPWVIARLSTIVGNSRTGKISQFNYFHQLLRCVPANRLPIIPGAPDACVDVIPDDWVVDGLDAILRTKVEFGKVFHLCAGPSQALTAQKLMELAFQLHHDRRLGSPSQMPQFVGQEEFEEFAKALRCRGEIALWRLSQLLLLYLPHLHTQQFFLNEKTDQFLQDAGVVRPPTQEYLSRIILACL